ncbi:unnamed protein product [Cercospora beticola]|nr:unnamed protein product [Cercospora beticola]
MTRVSLTLALGLLWLFTFGVVDATPCTQKYRQQEPKCLKAYKYEVIKTICDCVKQRCDKLPRCYLPQSTCRKPCGGYCASLGNDENNCGTCGTVCGSGQKCIGGKCTTPQPTCPKPTKWWCDGACVDRRADKNHCGGCGQKVSLFQPPTVVTSILTRSS